MNVFAHTSHVGTTGYNAHSQGFFRKLSEKCNLKIRNFTIGNDWKGGDNLADNPHGKNVNEIDKKILHQQTLFGANNSRSDYPIYSYDPDFVPDVNIILNCVNHYYFYDEYIGPKIAYVVWENTLYPEDFLNRLKTMDQVWVPSEWQAEITVNQGINRKKVKIVREAVDGEVFYPKPFKNESGVFRFVHFGAWSDRKSTKEIIKAFKNVFANNKKVELLISAGKAYEEDGCKNAIERLQKYDLAADNIKPIDFVSREDYISYLQNGHVFVSCARSEGWNIPLIEAMACGIPAIYSDCSGQLEFAKNKGIPVDIKGEISPSSFSKNNDSVGNWYEPDFKDLERKMLQVYNDYEYYRKKALKDSEEIRKEFTWENAANSAINHIKEIRKEETKVLVSCSLVGTGGFNSLCQNLLPELNNFCSVKVRNFTIGENWKSYSRSPHDLDIEEKHKEILHSQTLYNNENSRTDYPIYNHDPSFKQDLDIVICEADHVYYYDNYAASKIAYTMYETSLFPKSFLEKLKEFSQVWVPSEWQKKCLIQQNYPADKIKIAPLGVDGDIFYPNKNLKQKEKFTFMIFGRWDARKSTIEIIRAFQKNFKNNNKVELLISVDNPHDIDGLGTTENRLKKYDLESENIKILHFPNKKDYINHLQTGHVFLSCSKAEGWNLPLIEAMACGVPSVYSNCSGQLQFAKNLGIPIKIKEEKLASEFSDIQYSKNVEGNYYIPDFDILAERMLEIYNNYEYYKNIAILESQIIRDNFSWKKSAEICSQHIKDYFKNKPMIEFVRHTDSDKGIYFKNITNKKLSLKVKIFDTFYNKYVFESFLIADPNIEYFLSLNEQYDVIYGLLFIVCDQNDKELFKKYSLSHETVHELDYSVIQEKNNFCKNDISLKFRRKDNILLFYLRKSFENIQLIIKDLNFNIPIVYAHSGKSASFLEGLIYFFSPNKNRELCSDFFNGFRILAYKNNEKIFELEAPVDKNKFLSNKTLKFYSDSETDSEIIDGFYDQLSNFYNEDFYKKIVSENDIVLDVGASCGSFVHFCVSRRVQKVIALEPSKSFKILKETFKDFPNVFPENKALAVDSEKRTLVSCSTSTLSAFDMKAQLEVDRDKNIFNTFEMEVECITLADIFNKYNLDNINVLKMDIEGYEYEIFKNTKDSVLNKIDNIILEYHHNSGTKLKEIINKLKNIGFSIKGYSVTSNQEDETFNNDKGMLYACKEKSFHIVNESPALGDLIAWLPMVDKFQKQKNNKVIFYTPHKEYFEKEYPNIVFKFYNEAFSITDHKYHLGCYVVNGKKWNEYNLQELAANILGIEYEEIKCKVSLPENLKNNFSKKYVCIATQSTAQFKYWNNPTGWQETVDYLNGLGYEVVCIDKEKYFGSTEKINTIPERCTDKTGHLSLNERINDLYFCDFFIGLTSGLSWLAWAVGKPVILISGISKEYTEFKTPYRVSNTNVCHGCTTEKEYEFERNNWMSCPKNKNFECTSQITFEMVKEKIDILSKNSKNFYMKNYVAETADEIFQKEQYEQLVKVENNDFVVDLGCSFGYFYFKHRNKNIHYVGVDASVDCIKSFYENLSNDDKPIILNNLISDKKKIHRFEPFFHTALPKEVCAISFKDLIKLFNKKIDFLKFDIEGAEIEFFLGEDNYNLFKKSVKKFAGEIHLFNSNYLRTNLEMLNVEDFSRTHIKSLLKRMYDDKDLSIKLYSVDLVDITESFWDSPVPYTEIIINGKIN